jgi:hypothetical protein
VQWLSKSKAESAMRFYIIDFSAFDYSICFIQRNRPEGRNCNEDETSQNSRREDQFGWPLLPCLACLPAHTVSQQLPSINCVSHFWNLVLFFGLLCAAHALGQATGDHPRLLLSLKDERIPSLDFDSLFSCFSSGPIYLLSM